MRESLAKRCREAAQDWTLGPGELRNLLEEAADALSLILALHELVREKAEERAIGLAAKALLMEIIGERYEPRVVLYPAKS